MKLIFENWKKYLNETVRIRVSDDLQVRVGELSSKLKEIEKSFSEHARNANHNTFDPFDKFVRFGKRAIKNFHKDTFEEYWNKPSPDSGKTPIEELSQIDPALAEELLAVFDELEAMKNETPT